METTQNSNRKKPHGTGEDRLSFVCGFGFLVLVFLFGAFCLVLVLGCGFGLSPLFAPQAGLWTANGPRSL